MGIVPMSAQTLPQAKALVHRVFGHEGPAGWLFFWAWPHRDRPAARLLLARVGVASLGEFWLAIDDHGRVVGTVGLHRFRRDAREAVWLSWYCVAPESRGLGIGAHLLDYAIEKARESGARFLRLYTGDDPVMAEAQGAYESRGLRVARTYNLVFRRVLQRQLELAQADCRDGGPARAHNGIRTDDPPGRR